MQEKENPRMMEILLAYKKLKENATAQAYTSRKIGKSMLFSQRSAENNQRNSIFEN